MTEAAAVRPARRRLVLLLAAAALAVVAAAVWFRAAPSDPAVWHADPLTAVGAGRPNQHRLLPPGAPGADAESPVYALPAPELAARLDALILAEPRTARLAGSPDALWTTYVQRSALMGFPDYASIRVVPLGEDRSALAVWSRSRFGYSDLGVNAARVGRWLAALEAETAR